MKKKLLKIAKWFGIGTGLLILLLIGLFFYLNEPIPTGKVDPKTDQMVQQLFQAINKPAWDSTAYVQWTFKGMHTFLWDRDRHHCKVTWDDYEVLLDINAIGGLAKKDGKVLPNEAASKIIRKAWEFWCNDSFWLNAPSKIMDSGTTHTLVNYEGQDALMVKYGSGGVTPGDSYLWFFDEKGLPTKYKMWVKIIPFGGAEWTWEDWKTVETGAVISTFHNGMLDLDISDLKAGNSLEDMDLAVDPFELL